MDRWASHPWKLPLLGGLLLGSGYCFPLLVPNFVAFAPLLLWLDARPQARAYPRFRAGLVFGLATHLVSLHFLYSLLVFSWLALPLYLAFALGLALRIGLSTALAGWLRRRSGLSWGLLLPLSWVPLEWLQSFGDLRMTGEHLAHTLARFPALVQFADLTGPYGVGAVLLAANGLLYEALLAREVRGRRRAGAALLLLALLVGGYDAWAWYRPRPAVETTRVAIVQPNIPLEVKMARDTEGRQWEQLERLTRRAAALEPDLIVWPESARPWRLDHWLDRPETFAMPEVQALARELGVPLLVGAEYVRVRDARDFDYYNAALYVGASGRLDESWTAKVYLVPFTEGLPFRRWLGPLTEGRGGEWRWVRGGFTPGKRGALLDVDGARVGVLVCYEQLFADLARGLARAGATFQVVITNDAWFRRSLFQAYQANALRLRAIETRTAFVRAANTGISGFVDPLGRYEGRTALFETAVEVAEVPHATGGTLYTRTGDAVVWLCLLGLVGVGLGFRP